MEHFDAFYTPPDIAEEMVSAIRRSSLACVADFAVGDGRLLRAVEARLRTKHLIGMDIDPRVICRLRSRHPTWSLAVGDFLADQTDGSISKFQPAAVVMNPPYSNRGNSVREVAYEGGSVRCSPACAFALRALEWMAPGGVAVILMPESSLYSEKDRKVRRIIERAGDLQVVTSFFRPRFEGATVRSALVRIEKRRSHVDVSIPVPGADESVDCEFDIIRGGLPVHLAKPSRAVDRVPFLHTTSLSTLGASRLLQVRPYSRGLVLGPGVLLPRVGVPRALQIRVIGRDECFQLSDCVILVRTKAIKDARLLRMKLVNQIAALQAIYNGTGARYVTVSMLREWLAARA